MSNKMKKSPYKMMMKMIHQNKIFKIDTIVYKKIRLNAIIVKNLDILKKTANKRSLFNVQIVQIGYFFILKS